jgi:hypothetical protein
MLSVDYVMINELIKFKWSKAQQNNFLTHMFKKIYIIKHD